MLPGRNGFQVCADLRDGGRLDADPGADGQGRRPRRGRGPRHRRRRLPHQAVLVPGARRPASGRCCGGRPSGRRPPATAVGDLRVDPARRRVWRGDARGRADRPRVRRARVPRAPCRPGPVQGRHPRRGVGAATSRATRTSSRCTSAACAGRSTSPSAAAPSRRCGAPGTGWWPMAADRGAGRVTSTVRFRVTAVATLAVAAVLVVTAVGLVVVQRRALTDSLDETLAAEANAIAARIEDGGDPTDVRLDEPAVDDDAVAQVVVDGEVRGHDRRRRHPAAGPGTRRVVGHPHRRVGPRRGRGRSASPRSDSTTTAPSWCTSPPRSTTSRRARGCWPGRSPWRSRR